MARYLQKYVDTYRVLAEYNKDTHDYPRVLCGCNEGMLEPSFDDLYIPCASKSRIYHVGSNKLQAYIPSLGRGHNIIKAIYEDIIGDVQFLGREYKTIYANITKNGLIFDIEETDVEILFKFKANNIDIIAKYLKPKTSGAGISPFSTKNLPKSKYTIPEADLTIYKKLISVIPKDKMRVFIDMNNTFIETLESKTRKASDIKADMKLKGLKGKEYFHAIGEWDNYMLYIKGYLYSRLEENFRQQVPEVNI